MRTLHRVIYDALGGCPTRTVHKLHRELTSWFGGQCILETEDSDFDLQAFCDAGRAVAFASLEPGCISHAEYLHQSNGRTVRDEWYLGIFDVRWQGHDLKVLDVTICADLSRTYIVADSHVVAHRFFEAVCAHGYGTPDSIVCFHGTYRSSSTELRDEIAKFDLDQMVLTPEIREGLERDVIRFFDSKEAYHRFGIPWKRGVLLLGPPGNGKTHAIKALINRLNVNTVYVRELSDARHEASDGIRSIFSCARSMAPCLIVFEDLDTLVDEDCRSVFLNEMDGFASNDGLLILGTANDPAKLDPALVHRPSRFDRKLTFVPPSPVERRALLVSMTEKWDPAMSVGPETIDRLAELSDGFSYAYLKELGTSAMLAWFHQLPPRPMDEVLLEMVECLGREFRLGADAIAVTTAVT